MTASQPPVPVGEASEVILSASGLTKRFGDRQVLSDATFEVASGRAFGLLGPNGSGKTTAVRLLTGLLTPSDGSVTLFGRQLTSSNADSLRNRMGVQTDTNIYEALSVGDNLRTWGRLYGLSSGVIERRIDEVLDVLGLSDRVGSLAGELSKGMRQKLSVGRAVLHEPDLLFLDEPTAGLDPEASADLIAYLKEMIRTLSTTLVICTHQLHGLETLCDDIGILKSGRLIASGDVQQLLRRRWPKHSYLVAVEADPSMAAAIISSAVAEPVEVATHATGLRFSVTKEESISAIVSALVHHEVPVRSVIPQRPTVQDFYFATIAEEGPS